eukprot:gene25907-14065_t
MENPLDILLAAAERAAGPHTGDGQDLDDELDLEELAVTEGAAVFVDGGRDTAEMHHYVAGEDESLYVGAAEDTERDFDGFADAFTDDEDDDGGGGGGGGGGGKQQQTMAGAFAPKS